MAERGSYRTAREDFDELAKKHRVVPVLRRLYADNQSPLDVYRRLAQGNPGAFLLESAEQDGIWSRFSFVGVSSFGLLTVTEDAASAWVPFGLSEQDAFAGEEAPASPLTALNTLYEIWKTPRIPGLPPLTGGLVGFIGWEAVRELEHLPGQKQADYPLPAQSFSFVRELAVIDHKYSTITLICNVLVDDRTGTPADQADSSGAQAHSLDTDWDDAQRRLDTLTELLSTPIEPALFDVDFEIEAQPKNRTPKADFLSAVLKAKEYITAGDVFQVVIGQRFELDCEVSPIDVYRVLRTLNPSPYMYLLNHVDTNGVGYQIVGSSPEALVKVNEGHVITHPIAGSKPRGKTPEQDQELAQELITDEKERAEHLMLVDLARNDLLRVCAPGSVAVAEFMQIERFSHIMHIVSSVEGTLDPRFNSIDVFRATFPAGTLSGAPKPRALEIIDELEPSQRGIYGGVVGYFDFAGDADIAIAIRTALIRERVAYVQAGAGLVADSDPESEFQESQNKAAAPLRAVAIANTMTRVTDR